MDFPRIANRLPGWKNALLALLSAVLLILAFPDFDFWFLAWFALVPLMWAVEREKESPGKSFVLGWIFGTAFFFGTCWWLTYAPITYAAFPPILAYSLFFCVAAVAGLFPGLFAGLLAVLLRRFGTMAFLVAPFVWVFTEFLRYWLTGNNWNAIGYSQAFASKIALASYGGVYFAAFPLLIFQCLLLAYISGWPHFNGTGDFSKTFEAWWLVLVGSESERGGHEFLGGKPIEHRIVVYFIAVGVALLGFFYLIFWISSEAPLPRLGTSSLQASVVALQPNVPMSGLSEQKWRELRQRHVRLAETALTKLNEQLTTDHRPPTTVIFPESPMNFQYEDDPETKAFIDSFAAKHNVSVLFNSAEPDGTSGKYFNSAVLVGPEGREVAQYDKIYLLPFGESVPAPLQSIVPAFVGSFSYGSEYDLLPLGDAKAGVMICFESHFGQLSREYVRNGADVIIEMTNDGYLGPTPVLRQHLANAVFRAVETNRPVLRVTNVGITAYINERGEVLDAAAPYTEDTRVWSVAKSDGSQTFYVRYGDWFAWLCSVVTVGLLILGFMRRRSNDVRTPGVR